MRCRLPEGVAGCLPAVFPNACKIILELLLYTLKCHRITIPACPQRVLLLFLIYIRTFTLYSTSAHSVY